MVSTPSEPGDSAPSWCSRRQRRLIRARAPPGSRRCLRGGAVVLDRDRAGTGRRRADAEHDRSASRRRPPRRRDDPEVGRGQRLERLLLRAHHPLQRGVARLVDRVAHRDDRGQRRLDHVVADFGLAFDPHDDAVVEGELRGLRHERQLQPLGHRGPEHGATAVGRLLPEQHEVGRLALEHAGEHAARRDQVGAGDAPRRRRAPRGRRPCRDRCATTRSPPRAPSRRPRPRRSPASFSRNASSIAFLSVALSSPGPLRSSVPESGRMRRVPHGTCFTHTAIFMGCGSYRSAREGQRAARRSLTGRSPRPCSAPPAGAAASVANAAGGSRHGSGRVPARASSIGAPHALGAQRHVEVADAQVAERVDDRVLHRRGAADGGRLADALRAEGVER